MEYNVINYGDFVGHSTEEAVRVFFTSNGYRVIPYGQEQILKGINLWENRFKLNLPDVVTKAPDFILVWPSSDRHCCLEVKYRSEWNQITRQELVKDIAFQSKLWTTLKVLVASKHQKDNHNLLSSHVRVANVVTDEQVYVIPSKGNGRTLVPFINAEWHELTPIEEIFPGKYSTDSVESLLKAIKAMPTRPTDQETTKAARSLNKHQKEIWQSIARPASKGKK